MSNPLLNDRYFRGGTGPVIDATGTPTGYGQRPPDAAAYGTTRTGTMTMGGVASAAGVMLLFVLAGGVFGWNQVEATSTTIGGQTIDNTTFPTGWLFGSLIVALILALVCSFKPLMARFLAIPYAIAEGVFLGVISHTYDIRTQGVALQAVVATAAVFMVMLALYGFRVLRVTPRLTKGIIAATVGVGVLYLVAIISSFFTDSALNFLDSTSALSIGISFVVVGVAAFNLLLDFDFVERGVAQGLPKQMEWFAAFGLIVTIVWLYLELLRLLSKLQRR